MTESNLKDLSSPYGLDALEAEQKLQAEDNQKINKDLNKHYQLCFSTESGKKVLGHLKKCTIDQPSWIPSYNYNNNAVHHGFMREGQNSIVRNIIDRIEATKKGE